MMKYSQPTGVQPDYLLDEEIRLSHLIERWTNLGNYNFTEQEILKTLKHYRINYHKYNDRNNKDDVYECALLAMGLTGLELIRFTKDYFDDLYNFYINKDDLFKVECDLRYRKLSYEPENLPDFHTDEERKITEEERTECEKKGHKYKTIPIIIKLLGYDPMAYPKQNSQTGLKRQVYNKGKKLFPILFGMTFETFGQGGTSIWVKATNEGVIKEIK